MAGVKHQSILMEIMQFNNHNCSYNSKKATSNPSIWHKSMFYQVTPISKTIQLNYLECVRPLTTFTARQCAQTYLLHLVKQGICFRDVSVRGLTVDGTVIAENRLQNCYNLVTIKSVTVHFILRCCYYITILLYQSTVNRLRYSF